MQTIEKILNEFLLEQKIRGNSKNTIKYYQRFVGYFIKYAGNKNINEITIKDVKEYYVYNADKEISSETIKTYMRAVRVFLSWCYNEEYIKVNILEKYKLPKASKKVKNILTENEIELLFSSFNQNDFIQYRNYCICLLMLDSGLRMNEVTTLKISNSHINENYIIVDGKGNKQRAVPLGINTKNALLKYISIRNPVNHDNLFLDIHNKPINNYTIKNMIRKLKIKTGIKRIHAHLLRHTFATKYLENGGDIYTLQSILGHTSLEMVKKYIHTTPKKIVVNFSSFSPVDNLNKSP